MQVKDSEQLLLSLFSQGVDERIYLNENRYSYGLNPLDFDQINRGSCTCSPIGIDLQNRSLSLMSQMKHASDWIALKDQHREKLNAFFATDGASNHSIFFGASGTDLLYFPIILTQSIYPEAPILNIVTCIEELGSGSRYAAMGQYHAKKNQYGEDLNQGEVIDSSLRLQTVFLPARSEAGEIYQPEEEIKKWVEAHQGNPIIINLVYGSKSGIEDNMNLMKQIKAPNIIWNVDLCQFRNDKAILDELMDCEAMIMITGSKFYQAPPFCGAIVVPKKYLEGIQLSHLEKNAAKYHSVFSKSDFPPSLRTDIAINDEINKSGILRWEGAIREMEAYHQMDESVSNQKIQQWNEVVVSAISTYSCFELMPHSELTNNSIISFRVKGKRGYLSKSEFKAPKTNSTIIKRSKKGSKKV